MADDIQSWVKDIIEDSAFQWAFLHDQELDDTFGWGAMLKTMLSRLGTGESTPKERSSHSFGLLLTGPEGCGKHTASAHTLRQLYDTHDECAMLFISGTSLGNLGAARSVQYLDSLLEECIRRDHTVCIQLEDMEACPFRREVLTYFGKQLRYYTLQEYSEYPPLFLILIDSREQDIPACLRSQLMLCRMSLPTLEKRRDFLESQGSGLRGKLSLQHFAGITEGASYAQLLDMISAVTWHIASWNLDRLPDGELAAFLSDQMPLPTREDDLHKLVTSAQKMVDNMPQLLSKMGQGVPAVQPVPTAQPVPTISASNPDRGKIEKMPPRQLAAELFGGEEGVQEMLRTIQSNQ